MGTERTTITVSEAREQLAELVNQVVYKGERIVLTRHGKVVAAIINAADLDELDEIDAEDVAVAKARIAEESTPFKSDDYGAKKRRSRVAK